MCHSKTTLARTGKFVRLGSCGFAPFDLPMQSQEESEELGELAELGHVQVGDRAERHTVMLPENEVVTLDGLIVRKLHSLGPNEDVDKVFLPMVNQRGDIAIV